MISGAECLFMYLLAMCMSPLENVYLGLFPIFKLVYLFIYLLLNYVSSFYTLDIIPLIR